MIIRPKISKGTDTALATQYLIKEYDSNKEKRETCKVLIGSKELTDSVSDHFLKGSKRPYTSQVLFFKNSENIDDDKYIQVTQRYSELLFNNKNINAFAVLHASKNNKKRHIHFLFNNVDLDTGKKFNPYPYDPKNQKSMYEFNSALTRVLAYEFGLEQPPENKNISQISKKSTYFKFSTHNKNIEEALNKSEVIGTIIKDGVLSGDITDRDSLVKCLKDAGMKLSREGDNYISIDKSSFKNGTVKKNIRFSLDDSAIFSKNSSKEACQELKAFLEQPQDQMQPKAYTEHHYLADFEIVKAYTHARDNKIPYISPQNQAKTQYSPSKAITPPGHTNTSGGMEKPIPGGSGGSVGSSGGNIDSQIHSLISQIKDLERTFGKNSKQVMMLQIQLIQLQQQKEQEERRNNKEASSVYKM